MKQKIILAVSVAVGLLAAILTRVYVASREADAAAKLAEETARLQELSRKVDVVVTAKDLPAGTTLTMDDLRVTSMPERALSAQTIVYDQTISLRLVGRRLAMGVKKAKPLQWSEIEGGVPELRGLAEQVKRDMRAISVSVNGAASVSNMVRPTDHVDVLGTFSLPSKTVPGTTEMVTLTLLQDVLVLATGQQTAHGFAEGKSYGLVTLEVTPHEAEVLTFAEQMRGSLTLTLRNPKDKTYEAALQQVDFAKVREELETLNAERQKTLGNARR